MKGYLEKLPLEIKNLIARIENLAREKKISVYLVGGLVRDLFLKVKNLDLDFALETENILDFAKELVKEINADFIYHERFNTVSINYKFGKIDLAMTRKEFYPYPGSLPKVSFGTIRDDLYRRDFTINAMAIEIKEKKLVDFFGGKEDLDEGLIRILHEKSFLDDPTRILRAIRFKERFDFKIETQTFRFLKEAVRQRLLIRVSKQRIFDELIHCLKEENPLKQILGLKRHLDFKYLLGIKMDLKILKRIDNQCTWFMKNYPEEKFHIWLVYLFGLLDKLDLSSVKELLKLVPLKKETNRQILEYKKREGLIYPLFKKEVDPFRIYYILNPLCIEAIVFLKAKYLKEYFQKNIKDFLDYYRKVSLNVSGEDLKKLGIKPSPKYKEIFEQILKNKLKGKVKTYQEELEFIKKFLLK